MQHLTSPPDVSSLPAGDQPVITRALSKKPADRLPSCSEMVRARPQAGLGLWALRREVRPPAPPAVKPAVAVKPAAEPAPLNSSPSPLPAPTLARPSMGGMPAMAMQQTIVGLPEKK